MTRFLFFFQVSVGQTCYPYDAFVMEPKTYAPYKKTDWCWATNDQGDTVFILPIATVCTSEG